MTAPRLPVDPNSRVEGRPDYLTEEYLFTATVPVYMRLGEYHWLDGSKRRKDRTRSTFLASDQPLGDRLAALDEEATEPGGIVRCAERVNRIDDGMRNAWFPQGTGLVMDDVRYPHFIRSIPIFLTVDFLFYFSFRRMRSKCMLRLRT